MVSMACLDFPWAILLEKPLGYDLADAVAIRSAAETRNHDRMFVALNRRFYSSTRVVLDDIASCGEPRLVKVQDQEDLAAALKAIDYFRILGRGRIVDVDPVVPFNTENPGAMVCVLRFESGDLGLYEGVWNAPGPWAVNVSGPNRRWELRPLERASYQDRGERETHPVEPHEWDAMFKPGLRAQAAAAVAAALGQESSLVTLDDALSTMQLVDAMFHQTPIAGKRRSLADTR